MIDYEKLGIAAAVVVGLIVVAKLLQLAFVKFFLKEGHSFQWELGPNVVKHAKTPVLFFLILLGLSIAAPFAPIEELGLKRIHLFLKILSIGAFGWIVIGVMRGFANWVEIKANKGPNENTLRARRVSTQVRVLMRVATAIVVILSLVGCALVIPGMREIGLSLFASAGVAGIILGLAAKSTLANIVAGIQLAFTQPILLGDEVVVQGQTGTIDEISSNYVVVRMWDMRRLVVPLNYFMDNAFENLTYHEADLFGTVVFYTDYSVKVEPLREEAKRIVQASKNWDGKKCDMNVADLRENIVQHKVILSAMNSGTLAALQNEVREKLIDYLQREQPNALPHTRFEMIQEKKA